MMQGSAYSLVIEATPHSNDPLFSAFYSPTLEGLTGGGSSVEDCIDTARWGMLEQVELLEECGLSAPATEDSPSVLVRDQPARSSAAWRSPWPRA